MVFLSLLSTVTPLFYVCDWWEHGNKLLQQVGINVGWKGTHAGHTTKLLMGEVQALIYLTKNVHL